MAIINDGGGGTTSSICSVSPSDQVGQIDNILSRLDDLEATVSELLGADTSANQLSDLAQQAGWITGVTYLGIEGWTQTPAGTLIPPAGWMGLSTIIDGFQGTMYSGASSSRPTLLQYGSVFSDLTGSNFLAVNSSVASHFDPSYNYTDYFTVGTDDDGDPAWTVNIAGVYTIHMYIEVSDGSSTPSTGSWAAGIYKKQPATSGVTELAKDGAPWPGRFGSMTAICKFAAGDYINVRLDNDTNGDLTVTTVQMIAVFDRTV